MVAYSFQPQFVKPILAGLEPGPGRAWMKRQTIRAIGQRRHARPGDELQLYTGMRTRHCRLIGRARCVSVCAVVLLPTLDGGYVDVDGHQCSDAAALHAFAREDGFSGWDALVAFWQTQHPEVAGVFGGLLISWVPVGESDHGQTI